MLAFYIDFYEYSRYDDVMRMLLIAVVVGALLMVGVAALARAQGNRASGGDGERLARYRDAATVRGLIDVRDEPYTLIDVRTEQEFETGYIPTSINIPVQVIHSSPPDVERDSLVILYCRTGNRSGSAKRILEQQGFTRVVDFGGISRWPYPLEK